MEKTESKVHKVFKDSKVFKGRQEKEEKKFVLKPVFYFYLSTS